MRKKKENNMENYSKSEILQMVEEEDVEFIRLQFTDCLLYTSDAADE